MILWDAPPRCGAPTPGRAAGHPPPSMIRQKNRPLKGAAGAAAGGGEGDSAMNADDSVPADQGWRMPAEWEPHEATWIAWPHQKEDWPGKFAPVPWVYTE